MTHLLTKQYIESADKTVLDDMYNKIHDFLLDTKKVYKGIDLAGRWEYLIDKLYKYRRAKLQNNYYKNPTDKKLLEALQQYERSEAVREILVRIPTIKRHPDILEKWFTKNLSIQEKNKQHNLLPKTVRCITGTKAILATILEGEKLGVIFSQQSLGQSEQNKQLPKSIATNGIQLELFPVEDRRPFQTSEPQLPKLTKEEQDRLYNNAPDDDVYQYPWQEIHNR